MDFLKQKGPLAREFCNTLIYIISLVSLKPSSLQRVLTELQWNGMWFFSLAFFAVIFMEMLSDFLLVVAVLAFGTIFLFKKRMLQIRLTIFSTILLIGYYATLVTFIFMLKEESMTFSPSWTVCLPLVAIILNWLAIRAIGKDEVLVKAYDRLR